MNNEIVSAKITSLKRCVDRIAGKAPGKKETLEKDYDLQDIVSLNLQRSVQICVDIAAHIIAELDLRPPGSMAESFDRLHEAGILSEDIAERMKKISRFPQYCSS